MRNAQICLAVLKQDSRKNQHFSILKELLSFKTNKQWLIQTTSKVFFVQSKSSFQL